MAPTGRKVLRAAGEMRQGVEICTGDEVGVLVEVGSTGANVGSTGTEGGLGVGSVSGTRGGKLAL